MFDEDRAKEIMNNIQWHTGSFSSLADGIKPYREDDKFYSITEQTAILKKLADRYGLTEKWKLEKPADLNREARTILRSAAEEYWRDHEKELTAAGGLDRPLAEGEAACLTDLVEERLRKELNIYKPTFERFAFNPVTIDVTEAWKPKDLEAYVAMSAEAAKGVKDKIIGRENLHGDLTFTDPTQAPRDYLAELTPGERKSLDRLVEEVRRSKDMTPVMARIQPIRDGRPLYTKEEQAAILKSIPVSEDPEKSKTPEMIFRQAIWRGKGSQDFPYRIQGYSKDYADTRVLIKPQEEYLVKDLTTTYLLKEFNMTNPTAVDNWEPATVKWKIQPEQLEQYIRLAKESAQWIKDRFIGRELRHEDLRFTDPIRDYVPREMRAEIKKEGTAMEENIENKETQEARETQEKKTERMATSRRPAMYKEASEMIHRLANDVLKEGSIEPLVDRFERSENPVSRTQYRAVNALILREKAREMGYMDNRWITFNQCKAYSLHLNKGQKGVVITHYGIATQKEIDQMQKRTDRWNEAHPDEKKTISLKPGQRFAKDYFVYNAEQFSAFPPKTPEYTKEEQAKILSKIHEVTRGADAPLPENTSPREILQEGVSHVMYGENSPLQNAQLNMAERMMISELASGMLQKELNIRTPIRPESYDVNIVRDDELGKEAFDRIREKPTRIVAYLNMAETVIDQVKDRVIGRDMLHMEIPFSERMKTVDRSYNKEERIEYAKGKEAGLSKWEIETYMKPEIQDKWPKYRESFARIKDSTQKSMDRIRESMKITALDEKTVTCEAPRTLLEKIRTAQRKIYGWNDGKEGSRYLDPSKYLRDFQMKTNTFTYTMKANEKDPILAACGHRYEVRFGVEATFRDRKLKDLQKQIDRDVDLAKNPEKAKTRGRAQDKSLERTR